MQEVSDLLRQSDESMQKASELIVHLTNRIKIAVNELKTLAQSPRPPLPGDLLAVSLTLLKPQKMD